MIRNFITCGAPGFLVGIFVFYLGCMSGWKEWGRHWGALLVESMAFLLVVKKRGGEGRGSKILYIHFFSKGTRSDRKNFSGKNPTIFSQSMVFSTSAWTRSGDWGHGGRVCYHHTRHTLNSNILKKYHWYHTPRLQCPHAVALLASSSPTSAISPTSTWLIDHNAKNCKK